MQANDPDGYNQEKAIIESLHLLQLQAGVFLCAGGAIWEGKYSESMYRGKESTLSSTNSIIVHTHITIIQVFEKERGLAA